MPALGFAGGSLNVLSRGVRLIPRLANRLKYGLLPAWVHRHRRRTNFDFFRPRARHSFQRLPDPVDARLAMHTVDRDVHVPMMTEKAAALHHIVLER